MIKDAKCMHMVKVGAKGQIVIPKEVRDMFHILPGDQLILLADKKQGIALQHYHVFSKIANLILSGKAKEIYPEQNEEDSMKFAGEIKNLRREENDDGTCNSND